MKFYLKVFGFCVTSWMAFESPIFSQASSVQLRAEAVDTVSLYCHEKGGGIGNTRIKIGRENSLKIAYLGGSITYNAGWRDSLDNYFRTKYPTTEFEFINAGIPSMGSTPGAFRLERDVLSHGQIDLLFVEAAVNDETNGRSDREQIKALEGIIRHFRSSNPTGDIILMHFVDPGKMEVYSKGKVPQVIQNHNLVAEHYDLPVINLAKEVTLRIAAHEFSWKEDFRNLHPSPFGQGIYSRSMIHFLNLLLNDPTGKKEVIEHYPFRDPFAVKPYENGQLVDVSGTELTGSWFVDSNWKPADEAGTRSNYTDVPMLINKDGEGSVVLSFEGNAIGVAVAAGPDAGRIKYRIDDGKWRELDLYTKWSGQLHLPWYYTLESELEDSSHTLEIQMASSNDPFKNACRIRYFYINAI